METLNEISENLSFFKKYRYILIAVSLLALFLIFIYLYKNNNFFGNNQKKLTIEEGVDKDKVLENICNNIVNDYPEWERKSKDIVIWENIDKSFNYRNSPEEPSIKVSNPVPSNKALLDMVFIGTNEIAYTSKEDRKWSIGIFKINGSNAQENKTVYEKDEKVSYMKISAISRIEYIVFLINDDQGILKYINTESSNEVEILKTSSLNKDTVKLSVSPQKTSSYLLHDNNLIIFEVSSKKILDKVDSVNSAVWVGDKNILLSNSEGTFLYSLETKKVVKIDKIGISSNLSFNPNDGGVIAFNENNTAKILSCQGLQQINIDEGADLKTLTSEKGAITREGDRFGYWRFKNVNWDVNILQEDSKYVTIWQKY